MSFRTYLPSPFAFASKNRCQLAFKAYLVELAAGGLDPREQIAVIIGRSVSVLKRRCQVVTVFVGTVDDIENTARSAQCSLFP